MATAKTCRARMSRLALPASSGVSAGSAESPLAPPSRAAARSTPSGVADSVGVTRGMRAKAERRLLLADVVVGSREPFSHSTVRSQRGEMSRDRRATGHTTSHESKGGSMNAKQIRTLGVTTAIGGVT